MPISRYGEGYVMMGGYGEGYVMMWGGGGAILIPKVKGTLSGCIVSWIHEITGL